MKTNASTSSSGTNAFKKLSTFQKWCALITFLIVLLTTLPFTIVLLIGMLPTFTILLTDPRNSSKLIIVGVFGYILDIIGNFSLTHAFVVVGNIFNLIIMLSSAAFGLIVYSELPNLFLFFSRISAQKRLENIDRKLERLTEEWGDEILNNQASAKEKK